MPTWGKEEINFAVVISTVHRHGGGDYLVTFGEGGDLRPIVDAIEVKQTTRSIRPPGPDEGPEMSQLTINSQKSNHLRIDQLPIEILAQAILAGLQLNTWRLIVIPPELGAPLLVPLPHGGFFANSVNAIVGKDELQYDITPWHPPDG